MPLLEAIRNCFAHSQRQSAETEKRHRRRTSRRMVMESLERREVFSTDLLSAFAVGNGTGRTLAREVAADVAGNSYMAGLFSGTVDFDPSSAHPGDTDVPTARGAGDAYIAKYAPDNSLLWAQRMGGDSMIASATFGAIDEVADIKVDNNGNVFAVGNYAGSADFGSTTLTSAGDRDGFVTKLNSSGSFQWASRWGGTIDNSGRALDIDASGSIYATGNFKGTADFDPGTGTYNVSALGTSLSAFLVRLRRR